MTASFWCKEIPTLSRQKVIENALYIIHSIKSNRMVVENREGPINILLRGYHSPHAIQIRCKLASFSYFVIAFHCHNYGSVFCLGSYLDMTQNL